MVKPATCEDMDSSAPLGYLMSDNPKLADSVNRRWPVARDGVRAQTQAQATMTDIRPIFFTHVPKSAGTSLHAVFDGFFRSDEVIISDAVHTQDKIYGTPFRFLAPLRYLGGHYLDQLCEEKIGPAVRMTTIREPLERLQSFMNHTIRADGPQKAVFEAFQNGDARGLADFLDKAWYRSASPLNYYAPAALREALAADPGACVAAVAGHVLARYDVILESEGVDAFTEAVLPASAHSRGTRQMDGRKLGRYAEFRDTFGPAVTGLMAPDIALYEQMRAAVTQDPAAILQPRPRQVWWLDWDRPLPARGFLKRRMARLPQSLQTDFTSRLIEGRIASIFPDPGFAPARFSAILHLADPADAARVTLFNGTRPVPFDRRQLGPRVLFLSGAVPAGEPVREWAFDLSESRESSNVWLHDFVLYGADRAG